MAGLGSIGLMWKRKAAPIFIEPHPVSYYVRSRLEAEYKRLQYTGIGESVRYAQWALPAVPVLKHDGLLRVSGYDKVTVYKSLRKEVYPLPPPGDLFTKLEGGVRFAKLNIFHTQIIKNLIKCIQD